MGSKPPDSSSAPHIRTTAGPPSSRSPTTAPTPPRRSPTTNAGLVSTERDGNRIVYALAGPAVEELWAALRATTQAHAATLDRLAVDYLGDRSELETITRAELADRLDRDPPPVVLDVRPAAEFLAGHIPGAVSVPPDELAAQVRRLPRGADVVAYCRGSFCILADDAVRALGTRGGRAARLEDGFPEWRRAGLPVAVGDETVLGVAVVVGGPGDWADAGHEPLATG
jgi:rhodanese-related sulfurtransferase